MARIHLLFSLALGSSLLGGCGLHAVRPYERSHLKEASMQVDRDAALLGQRTRSLGLREAARDGRHDDVAGHR